MQRSCCKSSRTFEKVIFTAATRKMSVFAKDLSMSSSRLSEQWKEQFCNEEYHCSVSEVRKHVRYVGTDENMNVVSSW